MIREKIIPVAWLILACAIIGAAAGAKAHADPGDYYASTHAADVCLALDADPSITGLVTVMTDIAATTRLTDFQVGEAVALSVRYVCPHHVGLLRQFAAQYKGADGRAA